jgi:fructokinase
MIVIAGEALIDLIVGPDWTITPIPGGGPYNTARTIARLGGRVTFLGRISTDRFGRDLRANSVRMAVRVAALSCARPGADPPTLAELEAFPG